MSSIADRFNQPIEDTEILTPGNGLVLTPEALQDGRDRIAAGEDREKVILELAMLDVELRDTGEDFRAAGDVEGHEFHGNQWTTGTGSGTTLEKAKFDKVKNRSDSIAAKMGVPTAIINVVDKEPRAFTVGNQQFREAGHYNPTTGMIEINARNSYDDRMSVTNGIVAHEVSHAVYDAARLAQAAEHKEIQDLPSNEFNRLFRASGYVRPELQAEVHERWPVSAMFYRHIGDSYMETEADQQGTSRFARKAEELKRDDGVSEYSKSYWHPDAESRMGGFENAVNETLAETARHQVAGMSWTGNSPHASWTAFASDLLKMTSHPPVRARIGRRG